MVNGSENKKMNVVAGDEQQVVLREKQPNRELMQWTYSPDRGYALVKYAIISPADVYHGLPYVEINCDDLRNVNGVYVPFQLTYRVLSVDGTEMMRSVMTVRDFKVSDPSNKDDLYHMVWPKGVEILDRRNGSFVMNLGGDRTLDDKQLEDLRVGEEQEQRER